MLSIRSLSRAAPAAAMALAVSGCFSSPTPVIEPAAGEALPGGPGIYRLMDDDGKPHGRLVITAQKGGGPGQRYRVRAETMADGRWKIEEGDLLVRSAGGGRYLAQFRESENRYFLAPAQITAARFTVMVVDTEALTKIAERHGVRTVQEPVAGDKGEVQAAIQSGASVLVLTIDGAVLHAPRDKALVIALEMAASDEAVPLGDSDWHRQTK